MNEPQSFSAGDTVTWTESLADYLASAGWILNYRLSGPQQIDLISVADGDDHKITITKAISADYGAGVYQWQSYVEKGTERFTIARGRIEILADLTQVEGTAEYDARSHVQKVFDAIKATIESRATKSQSEIVIAGRSLKYLDPGELITWYHHYEALVKQEQNAERINQGLKVSNKILTRFDSIS
jgi:hypothetical protein